MITCRVLQYHEVEVYEWFMRSRSYDSRSMYFGYPITDEGLTQLASDIKKNSHKHHIVVAEDDQLEVVGMIHIASMDLTTVELGVMVAESHRNQGISSQMMDYTITWCKNRNLSHVYMHCLSYNRPILHLVKKHGLEITKDGTDADARVTLPMPNIFTYGYESVLRQQSLAKQHLLQFKKLIAA